MGIYFIHILVLKIVKNLMYFVIKDVNSNSDLDSKYSTYIRTLSPSVTSLTTDKRFVLLDNVWDLRDNHSIEIAYDEEDEEEEEFMEEEEDEELEEEQIEEDTLYDDENDVTDDDDMDDLEIVEEEDISEE